MAVLDKVTDFLFLLGKLLIVGSVGECHWSACWEAVVGVTCEGLLGPMSSFVTPAVVSEVVLGGGAASFSQNPQPYRFLPSLGILAFFFFTHRIRIVQDTAPPLNYYWVPILVRTFGDGWGPREKEALGSSRSLWTRQMWMEGRGGGLIIQFTNM